MIQEPVKKSDNMEKAEIIAGTKWSIDPSHSEIGFRVKHLMITNVKGVFKEFTADILADDDDFTNARVVVRINPSSIDTGDTQRDAHLRSADFFDAENHPEIRFTATSLEQSGHKGAFVMTGDLDIRGNSRKISLDVIFEGLMKDPWGNRKAGFSVTGKINRKDWGLNWNAALEAGGMLVSDEVRITCEVQLVMS
jgi:polyisoprenoid-binding protein YceI